MFRGEVKFLTGGDSQEEFEIVRDLLWQLIRCESGTNGTVRMKEAKHTYGFLLCPVRFAWGFFHARRAGTGKKESL